MRNIKFSIVFIFVLLTLIGCKEQQARMPISRNSGAFMNESVERNKKLIKGEEKQIDSIIKSNPQIKYLSSQKGYWYHYDVKNDSDTLRPKKGDVAFFDYEIKDIAGNVIYSQLELKPQTYLVDKQNIMSGLRHGIKQMHKKETVTFLFPSHLAFGYHGDDRRIGTNEPLICTVTLNDFKPENKQ
ncbi:gliding motility-associated peptidyl-prolyl isomerase GldI [Flavobacterium sp.]|jgi:gliding motility-associated peptidyl-prolyl isomerase|uniref:gliding motility-associated peptidyl-prolyl isomerase GldI n=1 Tax=Flavobacterium sp. TaxID=239 RepID=UPI0037BEEDF0